MKIKNNPFAVAGMIAAALMMCLSSYGFTVSMDAADNSIADANGAVYDSQEEIRGKSGSRVSYIRFYLDAAGGPIGVIAAGDIESASLDLYITVHGDSELMEIYLLQDGAQYSITNLSETTWTGGTDGTEPGGNNLTINNAPHGPFLGEDSELLTLGDDVAQNGTTNLIKLIGTFTFPGNPADQVSDDNILTDQVVRFPITDMETFKAAVSNDTNGEMTFIVLTRNFIDGNDYRAASLFNTGGFAVPRLTITDETDTTAPDAPANVVLTTERDAVGLDWDTMSLDPTLRGYRVYRTATSGSGYIQQAELDQGSSVFSDTNIVYGTNYYYVLTSFDASGNESTNSIEIAATPFLDVTAPAAPVVSAIAGDGVITLSWTDSGETDIGSYNVFRSETSGSYGAALSSTTEQTYVDTNVVNGTTYYYKVIAVDDSISGNESGYVEISAVPGVFTGDSTVFGSDHDGLNGFIQSTVVPGESWTEGTNSVIYTSTLDGNENFSLLKSFPLDRSAGKSYKITASLKWDAYADDNNRVGIYMFGDETDLGVDPGEDEQGAVGMLYNADKNELRATVGIDYDKFNDVDKNGAPPPAIFTDYTLAFEVDINFVDVSGTTYIHIECVLTDNEGVETVNSVNEFTEPDEYSGLADEYTGNLFGFVYRGQGDAVNYTSNVVKMMTFSIADTTITNTPPPELDDYEQWLEDSGLPTDSEGTNDYDGDGIANLYEYGVVGNPDDDTDTGTAPTFTNVGDSFIYVHPQRSDTDILTYTVETTTNLVTGPWVADGYTVSGTNDTGGDINFVSNTVTSVENEKFIRLKIEKTE